jgi:hypothetical protein
MTDLGSEPGVGIATILGSTAGAGISLIYLLPRTCREAASRFLTGMSFGLIFGEPMGVWLTTKLGIEGELSGSKVMLAGSAAASLCAWWVLGALAGVAGRYGKRQR